VSKVTGERYALGLFTSAGALAIVMPPSINMILFATATGASTGALFLAGIIPAMIIGLFYAVYIYMSSPAPDRKEDFSLKYAFRKTLEGLPVLMFPVLILGGIYLGVFTPTEAGAVSAVYAFVLPFLFWREMGIQDIVESIKNSVKLTAQIFILIAASIVFSQALTMSHVPEILRQSLGSLGPFWFMVFLNIILLFVGCFFDPSSAVLVLGPVMAPIAEALGIDLLHLGVVFAVNLAIGMFTPPFGLNLFIIQSIFNRPLDQIARSVPRFFVVFLLALIIITYFPQIYMWLPRLWLAH
jgi:C4-dicarboxylate transporter DctM subunit